MFLPYITHSGYKKVRGQPEAAGRCDQSFDTKKLLINNSLNDIQLDLLKINKNLKSE